jgi:protein-L-isoaspartate(D-aspartate) O-methyltransferase
MPRWLHNQQELVIVRRTYARLMLAIANVRNDRLEQVFATVRREDFLGDEPWRIGREPALPVNDPIYVYQDVVLALAPERGVNNGSPSFGPTPFPWTVEVLGSRYNL